MTTTKYQNIYKTCIIHNSLVIILQGNNESFGETVVAYSKYSAKDIAAEINQSPSFNILFPFLSHEVR